VGILSHGRNLYSGLFPCYFSSSDRLHHFFLSAFLAPLSGQGVCALDSFVSLFLFFCFFFSCLYVFLTLWPPGTGHLGLFFFGEPGFPSWDWLRRLYACRLALPAPYWLTRFSPSLSCIPCVPAFLLWRFLTLIPLTVCSSISFWKLD